MANLRVFISSTYYDLKHVRSYISEFISKMGYEATLSEKGKIAYDPSSPLDRSCYSDAEAADMFVLVVGGRYGSVTSEAYGTKSADNDFYDRYESVTRKEFESASLKNIPTYILVEKSVMSEYETFKKNRENTTIKYAHVDSVNIFYFIDEIMKKGKNNPVFHFEQPQEIESWLKSQWSGYFKILLDKKTQSQELSSLNSQVSELGSINSSLQRYLEQVIEKIAGDSAEKIISDEHQKLADEKQDRELLKINTIETLVRVHKFSLEEVKTFYRDANVIDDIVIAFCKSMKDQNVGEVIRFWKEDDSMKDKVNKARDILELPSLDFVAEDEPI
ncbi:MAG: DUF4062 domain-containing protein [Bermanella sp.]